MHDIQLVKLPNPFDISKKDVKQVAYYPELRLRDLAVRANLGPDVVVLRNNCIETDLDQPVNPGDWVHVLPAIHGDTFKTIAMIVLAIVAFYVVAPFVAAELGFTAGTTAFKIASTVVGMVTMTAGGMLLNALMPPPAVQPPGPAMQDSPTYGWGGKYNPTQEGQPIPVIYGEVATSPMIINHYLEIDANGEQWAHTLLAKAEGLINNLVTAADIYANNEPLTLYEDYIVKATDGSNTPDTTALDKFQKLHQYRMFNKPVIGEVLAENTYSLLNFNGTEGSTSILEMSGYTHNWTCHGNADLSTAHPFLGSADLEILIAGDYISSGNADAFNLFTSGFPEWDMELRFRQATLADSGIVGQQRISTTYEFYWGLFYDDAAGKLGFQVYKRVWIVDPGIWQTTEFFSAWGSVTLSTDTWHHIRVAKNTDDQIRIYLDGAIVLTADPLTTLEQPQAGGTWTQQIGYAYYNDSGTPTKWDGLCETDEFRLVKNQLVYDWDVFTPPTEELVIPGGQTFETRGVCDEITVTIEAGYGLYHMDTSGNLNNLSVTFRIFYTVLGADSWSGVTFTISGASRYPVRKQCTITLPSRDKYEIRVVRVTAEHEDTRKASKTYWIALDEVLDEFLHYPNLQLVSISLKAQDKISGSVPVYKIVSNRSSIMVPMFDGAGTQAVDPTNPAWAAYDALTNQLYGAGIDPTRLLEAEWQDWIDWCDGIVYGSVKRCRVNMVFDVENDLDKALQHFENVGRARIVPRGTKIGVVIERPAQPAALFSAGNIIENSFEVTWIPQAERVDAVEVEFLDKDQLWGRNSVLAKSAGYESLTRVPRIARLFLPGINNLEQAEREAKFRINISDSIKRRISFEAGIDGIMCCAGDLVYFQHDGNALTVGGRLAEDVSGDQIVIDRALTLDAETYQTNCKIWVRKTDDTIVESEVTGPFDEETDTFRLADQLTASRFDVYMIGRNTGEKWQYRIASLSRSKTQHLTVKGIQYKETAYYHPDYAGGLVPI